MSLLQAFIFGLLQGVTEFLPVSSSAHLKLAKTFFNVDPSESQVIFDLVCHLGTLIALLFFLKDDLFRIFRRDRRQVLLLFVATLPLIPCYFFLKPLRDLASNPQFLGLCLMVTALILYTGQRWKLTRNASPNLRKQMNDVLWIGALQSAALIPGISRSASTISCATVLGWDAKDAVRFSFLLSIPTIIGGNCLELLKLYISHEIPSGVSMPACAIGLITSFIVGFIVIRFALSFLEKGNFKPFAWYCFSLGVFATIYLNWEIPNG